MTRQTTYKDYFNIDPQYYAAVTKDLIDSGTVSWKSFYPHPSFVTLLERLHDMLSGRDSRSLWVEGAYGTGKSHAVLTVKSMLEADDDEVRAYFEDYGLSMDLCQKLLTDRNQGTLLTVHRIGSASIRSDADLIDAVQSGIMDALSARGIENRGESSLRMSALKWLQEAEENRNFFNSKITKSANVLSFNGRDVNAVMDVLQNGSEAETASLMREIIRVAKQEGITAMQMNVDDTCSWIKSVIRENSLSGILFIWDEFTEYFQNNVHALTGFQTLAELSASVPFYFLIVTHESQALISDKDERRKLMNRFVKDSAILIDLPDNMAFRLMAQAMKVTGDPVLAAEWEEFSQDLNDGLESVRSYIIRTARKNAKQGEKTIITDEDLKGILPIHPYAGLLLKHMSVAFQSNARSMFDFIISNDMTEAKSFKYYIENFGPVDEQNLLTIDMLWEYFTAKNQSGLADDVRGILDSWDLLQADKLTPDEARVMKTVLLLEAISLRVSDVELLRPGAQNVDLAFSGTRWRKGKARDIAAGLCQKGLLFERPVGGGVNEYTVASRNGDQTEIRRLKDRISSETTTQALLTTAELLTSAANPAVQMQAPLAGRFILTAACNATLQQVIRGGRTHTGPGRFQTIVCFARDDTELHALTSAIPKAAAGSDNELYFILSLVPLGTDRLNRYVENSAFSQYYMQKERDRARGFEKQAGLTLSEWRTDISNGAFMFYTPQRPGGDRAADLSALQEMLMDLDREIYPLGLEHYTVYDSMFTFGPVAQGAECGIRQETKGVFNSGNERTKLSTALRGAWKTERYWEDPAKQSLPIVRIKKRVDRLVQEGMQASPDGVSFYSILVALTAPPCGFMPNSLTAFVLGFVMKEYAAPGYFWSNRMKSQPMSIELMKDMIAAALKQLHAPSAKFREEYIRQISEEVSAFLRCTEEVFHLKGLTSVDDARSQMRNEMKKLVFPIWCVKSTLHGAVRKTDSTVLERIIDDYTGIANTGNAGGISESTLAEDIGTLVLHNPEAPADLKQLLTVENCRTGMLRYIGNYRDGILQQLAAQINDGGAYMERLKERFSVDAAAWVWSADTASEKIDDVILEYQIIAESRRILGRHTSLQDVEKEWNRRSDQIRMPYEVLKHYTGDLQGFLEQLYYLKQSGKLADQNKQQFLEQLQQNREEFDRFYKDQLPVFRQAAETYIEDLSADDVEPFFRSLPAGQFLKTTGEYFNMLEARVSEYLQNQKQNRVRELWNTRTGSKSPKDWSRQYLTPILCMFDDSSRAEAKEFFSILHNPAASDADVSRAEIWLEQADFYPRLQDAAERDRCFMERVVGDQAVLLPDPDEVRSDLQKNLADAPYDWMDSAAVRNRLKKLAEKKFQTGGYDEIRKFFGGMSDEELRDFLDTLFARDPSLSMEILKYAWEWSRRDG